MRTDFALAVAHHLLVFTLVALLAAEFTLLRSRVGGEAARWLARVDAGYGACAALVVAAGVARVVFGIKGPRYYLFNAWFWGKMGAFLLIAVLSAVPTVSVLRWRRAARGDPTFAPGADQIMRCRRVVAGELALIAVVLACAAAMARAGAL